MKLNFKASNIAKAEQRFGIKLFPALQNLSVQDGENANIGIIDVLFLWCAGGGDEESFDTEVDKDIEQVMLDIMAGLNNAGFLGMKGKLNMEEAKKELRGLTKKS